MYDLTNLDAIPKRYTVEAGKVLTDEWNLPANYDLEVYGPNGYFRKFRGDIRRNEPAIVVTYDYLYGRLSISVRNTADIPISVKLVSNAYNYPRIPIVQISKLKTKTFSWDLKPGMNWYDFSVETAGGYLYRLAGRVETGKHGISDPAMCADI